MKRLLTHVMGIIIMLGVLTTAAEAATLTLTPNSTQTSVGATVTLTIDGSSFVSDTFAGVFTTTWDPTILQLASASIANPPWDATVVSDTNPNDGLLDSIFVQSTGGVDPDFLIGTLTFDVVGTGATVVSTTDTILDAWLTTGGAPIVVTHVDAVVSSVPVPAAVWLFCSGLLGMIGIARRKKAA